jgi:hypothetical protein
LPSVTVAVPERLCVPAATEVSHGLMCATVEAPGRVSGRRGDEDARAGGEQERDLDRVEVVRLVPLIEKLITSTPSATA